VLSIRGCWISFCVWVWWKNVIVNEIVGFRVMQFTCAPCFYTNGFVVVVVILLLPIHKWQLCSLVVALTSFPDGTPSNFLTFFLPLESREYLIQIFLSFLLLLVVLHNKVFFFPPAPPISSSWLFFCYSVFPRSRNKVFFWGGPFSLMKSLPHGLITSIYLFLFFSPWWNLCSLALITKLYFPRLILVSTLCFMV
jgi:hypothetical protein